MCPTQCNNKDGSSLAQKETAKLSFHFETMKKNDRDLAWQSHKKAAIVPLRGPINKMREKENYDSPHNITMRMVISDSKVSNKVECPFGNNRKTLQGAYVTLWKWMKNYRKLCGIPHSIITRMAHQWLKWNHKSEASTSKHCRNITGTLCDNQTRRIGQFHWDN